MSKIIRKRLKFNVSVVRSFLFFFILFLYAGCEKRTTISPTPGMESPDTDRIRVLLFDNIRHCNMTCRNGFIVSDTGSGASADFGSTRGSIELEYVSGKIRIGRHFFSKEVKIQPESPFVFGIDDKYYRGDLKIIADNEEQSLKMINSVPLEAYLAGVVGAEMPSYWEPEALKAQVIASRTYCLHIRNKFGKNRSWDVKRTQAHQVYLGLSIESVTVWRAINETKGFVLVCELNGEQKIFPAYYSSTCGGHTENSENVFGDSYGPLMGVECPYCREVAKTKLYFWPTVKLSVEQISERLMKRYSGLSKLVKIASVEPENISTYGPIERVTSVKLTGTNGKVDFLRGEDFRLAVDPTGWKLRSAIFKLTRKKDGLLFSDGRGYGHGVGMCQCGAQGMARHGRNCREILEYYFPGSSIKSLSDLDYE